MDTTKLSLREPIPKSKTPFENHSMASTEYEPDESLFKEFLFKYKTRYVLNLQLLFVKLCTFFDSLISGT